MIWELTEAALSLQDDLDIHAAVLSGMDKAFSAGSDLQDGLFAKLDSPALTGRDDQVLRHRFYSGVRLCKLWEELPQITIAAMERMSIGGGVAFALACD